MSAGAEENRGDTGEGIAGDEDDFAIGDMVAEPAAEISGAGVEDVVESIKADGETGGASKAVTWCEHARGIEN